MREYGDLSGIVWNRQTGHLVGAHQRIANLPPTAKIVWSDETNGVVRVKGQDWRVRVVDWDEPREKRANIVANNPQLQGEFDTDALAALLTQVRFDEVGLSQIDVEATFSEEQIASILGRPSVTDDSQEPDEVKDAIRQLGEVSEAAKAPPGAFKDSIGTQVRRKAAQNETDIANYRTVVFESNAEARTFMEALGYPPDQRYADGKYLLRLLQGENEKEKEQPAEKQEQAQQPEGETNMGKKKGCKGGKGGKGK